MKYIKFLFLTAIFCASSSLTLAQESKSDATWEETIGFLNKYKNEMTVWASPYKGMPDKPSYERHYLTNKKWTIDVSASGRVRMTNGYTQRKDVENITIPLADLSKASLIESDNAIGLRTTGDDIVRDETMYNDGVVNKRYTKVIRSPYLRVFVADKEMLPRIHKALSHLADLATQKREQMRKASGDKF